MPRRLANLLLVVGAVCLLTVGAVEVEGRWLAARHRPEALAAGPSDGVGSPAAGAAVAWIRMPRLEVSALVREGIEADVLRASVGHLPRTALPGAAGNVVLAGHRDSFFRALEGVRVGDRIWLMASSGSFGYRVVSAEVVDPHRTELLRSTEEPLLTLVTCYPFRYVGPAPQRFVVRAVLEPAARIG